MWKESLQAWTAKTDTLHEDLVAFVILPLSTAIIPSLVEELFRNNVK